MHHHAVTFNFGYAKVCSPALFETCFSYDQEIWIAANDYCMYFNIIMLFSLTAILQLKKFYSFLIFILLIDAVILLMNYLVIILYLYITFSFS